MKDKEIRIETTHDWSLGAVFIDASMDGEPKGSVEVPLPFIDKLIVDLQASKAKLEAQDAEYISSVFKEIEDD